MDNSAMMNKKNNRIISICIVILTIISSNIVSSIKANASGFEVVTCEPSMTQTVTYVLDQSITGYYWGKDNNYKNNTYTKVSRDTETIKKKITQTGTYYLTCYIEFIDSTGKSNGSQMWTSTIVYHKAILNPNGGSVSPEYVLGTSKAGYKTKLPIPEKKGYTFKGWGLTKNSRNLAYEFHGEEDETYYAIWDNTPTESTESSTTSNSLPTEPTNSSVDETNPSSSVTEPSINETEPSITVPPSKKTQRITAKSFIKTYGAKAFNLNAKTSGNGKLSYKSSNKKVAIVSSKGKVSIKGCGKATITIKASVTSKYKVASKKITVIVKPATVKIKSIVGKNNYIRLKFQKQLGLSGYEVEVAKKSSFSSKVSNKYNNGSRTTCKITGVAKGQKYYVRIRACAKINKKTVNSKWTKRVVVIN